MRTDNVIKIFENIMGWIKKLAMAAVEGDVCQASPCPNFPLVQVIPGSQKLFEEFRKI